MKIKVTNPYSEEENPIAWRGWEIGFRSPPNSVPSATEKAVYGTEFKAFEKAFYRGQGAQTIRKHLSK
jgi:hypothetical protein